MTEPSQSSPTTDTYLCACLNTHLSARGMHNYTCTGAHAHPVELCVYVLLLLPTLESMPMLERSRHVLPLKAFTRPSNSLAATALHACSPMHNRESVRSGLVRRVALPSTLGPYVQGTSKDAGRETYYTPALCSQVDLHVTLPHDRGKGLNRSLTAAAAAARRAREHLEQAKMRIMQRGQHTPGIPVPVSPTLPYPTKTLNTAYLPFPMHMPPHPTCRRWYIICVSCAPAPQPHPQCHPALPFAASPRPTHRSQP